MGGVVGKGSTPVPDYNVLGHGASYELRAYDGYVVAEVENSREGSEDDRFRTLAKVREGASSLNKEKHRE